MANYRRIYEHHYGPIPRDLDGRTYDIHHIDGNDENDSPENLKAVTIQEHFDIHYSQNDLSACLLIAVRMNKSPEEISELASRAAQKRVADGTHPFLGGEISRKTQERRIADGSHHLLRRSDGTSLTSDRVADGTNPFQTRPDGTSLSSDRVEDGTHNLLRRPDGTSHATDRVANGTHNFLDGEIARKTNRRRVANKTHNFQTRPDGTNLQTDRVADGTHNFQTVYHCSHCNRDIKGIGNFNRWHNNNCKFKR